MGTIANKLQALASTKAALKAALVEKGQNPSDDLSTYGDLIRGIQSDSIKLEGIEVVKPPYKTRYDVGENFLPNELELQATFSNGGKKAVYSSLKSLGYTRLEYIESTGTQYINTGMTASYGFKIETNVSFSNVAISNHIVGAARGTDSYNSLAYDGEETSWILGVGTGKSHKERIKPNVFYSIEASTGLSPNSYLKVNGKEKIYVPPKQGSAIVTRYGGILYLFSINVNDNTPVLSSMKIKETKLYAGNGYLIRYFIPCKNSNGIIGMYDMVNEKFYTSAGTEDFVAGPEASVYEVVGGNNLTTDTNEVLIRYTENDIVKDVKIPIIVTNKAKAIIKVSPITATHGKYVSSQYEYVNEEFVRIEIMANRYATIKVSYGGITKTIKYSGNIEDYDDRQVFFGTFRGESDGIDPTTGEMIIEGDIKYYDDGSYSKTSSSGVTSYYYPSFISGITSFGEIESIPGSLFEANLSLQNIILPEGITSIGSEAFYQCISLQEITIPEGVTQIHACAFSKCKALNKISLPSSLKSLFSGVFSDCVSLTNIVIPENVESIFINVFSGCTSLTSIQFLDTSSKWFLPDGTLIDVSDPIANVAYFSGSTNYTAYKMPV